MSNHFKASNQLRAADQFKTSTRIEDSAGTAFGAPCAQCGSLLIAPIWSEHVSAVCVRHLWSCEACDYEFESLVYFSPDGNCFARMIDQSPSLAVIEEAELRERPTAG